MKRMRTWQWAMVALLAGTLAARGGDFSIQSFDGVGRLTFGEIPTATTYRVEWAPSPDGPWTTFKAAALAIDKIVAKGSGIVTCSVPMCYRVVATVTNETSCPAGMVLVPGGTNSGTDPDFGAYNLTVSPFYMDATEVTKAKWDEVRTWAINNGYSFDNAGSGKAADHPVQAVNWYDCVKWCNARSEKEGHSAVYTVSGAVYKTGQRDAVVQTTALGYRLPTEVEWEYAARGGVAGRRFPWGDSNDIQHTRANYKSSSSDSYDTSPTRGYHPTYNDSTLPYTSPVGSFAANGYGLYDMAGNVFEWCFNWVDVGPSRVWRGGCWLFTSTNSRIGKRTGDDSDYAFSYVGFRAVLPPGQ